MNFKKFTKMNQVVKAAKFELVPCGSTRDFLVAHNVIESDIARKNSVTLVKEIADEFVRDFISSVSAGNYDWTSLENIAGVPEYKGAAEKMKASIAATIEKAFIAYINERAESYSIKNAISWPSAAFVEVLLPVYAAQHDKFNSVKYEQALASLEQASSTLFKNHFSRYALIISGVKHGSIANRVLENFEIYLYNKTVLNKFGHCITSVIPYDINCMTNNANNMNSFMSQNGITQYNSLISGEYSEDGVCLAEGLNQIINKYNQNNPDCKMPMLKQMYKQILIESAPAFVVEVISDNKDFKRSLEGMHELSEVVINKTGKLVENIESVYSNNNVYVTVACKRSISNDLCGEWNYIDNMQAFAIAETIKKTYFESKGKEKSSLTKKDEETVRKVVNSQAISVAEMNRILGDVGAITAESYFANLYAQYSNNIHTAYSKMIHCKFWKTGAKPQWEENAVAQEYLDSVLAMTSIVNCFVTDITKIDCDIDMISLINELQDKRKEIVKVYNMIRNYVTKKPEQDAKKQSAQLMFGRASHLSQVWQNKQAGKFGNPDAAILEYDGKFYYMVSAAEKQKLAIPIVAKKERKSGVEYYNYLSTKKNIKLSMALPKQTFSSKKALELYATASSDEEEFDIPLGDNYITVSKKMYNDYAVKTFRQDESAKIALIDFAKEFISKDTSFSEYDFSSLKPSAEYSTYGEFCDAVDAIAFKVENKFISKEAVDAGVEEGKLYLFLIKNQDMYKPREKCKDKTALRFRAAIEGMFNGNTSIILNNAPQIMYRPAIIEGRDVHPAGSVLVNKLTSDGHKIPDDVYREIYEYCNGRSVKLSDEANAYMSRIVTKKSGFAHVKDAHYSREMFTITVTYTINKGVSSPVSGYELNKRVLNAMNNENFNVMTVIRATENLLYYYICSRNGDKIESGNLNIVGGVDYLERLSLLGNERYARQTRWDYSMEDKVSKTKDQYLSQVCSEIVKIAVKHNAVIVVDQLSKNMKAKAPGFDNKVYAKFEDQLVKSLSDYTDSSLADNVPGGVVNPLQLTTAEPMKGYQNGIVFFVSTAMTKNACPETGFINVLPMRNICTVEAKRQCLAAMNRIYFDKTSEEFVFEFSFDKIGSYFNQDELPENICKIWCVRTCGSRKVYNNQKHVYETVSAETITAGLNNDAIDISKDIDVAELGPSNICMLYNAFCVYASGFAKNGRWIQYISPIVGPVGTSYDELTAKCVNRKALLMIGKLLEGRKGADAVISSKEWYDILTANK